MALLVLRRGQLVYERYFNGYFADSTAAQSGRPGRSEADQRNIEHLGTPQAAFYA